MEVKMICGNVNDDDIDIYERDYEYNFIKDENDGHVKYIVYHESGNYIDKNCPQTVCIPVAVFNKILEDYLEANSKENTTNAE